MPWAKGIAMGEAGRTGQSPGDGRLGVKIERSGEKLPSRALACNDFHARKALTYQTSRLATHQGDFSCLPAVGIVPTPLRSFTSAACAAALACKRRAVQAV